MKIDNPIMFRKWVLSGAIKIPHYENAKSNDKFVYKLTTCISCNRLIKKYCPNTPEALKYINVGLETCRTNNIECRAK